MDFKTLSSVLVLGLALSACCGTSQDANVDGGMDGEATPGSAADFKKNVGDRVFFGFDKSHITKESAHTIHQQAEWLKKYPNTHVVVEGYCDERGTVEYNLALGERRASADKKALVKNGIHANRIETVSYGKEKTLVPGHTEEAYAQNRVAVTVVK